MSSFDAIFVDQLLRSEEYPSPSELNRFDEMMRSVVSRADLESCKKLLLALADDVPQQDLCFLLLKTIEQFSPEIEAHAFWLCKEHINAAPKSMFTAFVRMTNSPRHQDELTRFYPRQNDLGDEALSNQIERHLARGQGNKEILTLWLGILRQP